MGSSTVTATGTSTATSTAPKKMTTTYSLYSKKPFWDSDRSKIDCENAKGRDIKGNNGDYANYCIFTGADAEVNAQNACTSSDECVGYVGAEGSKNMYQLTSMPKADTDANSTRRFYVRTPLPPSRKNIELPAAGFINQRPSLAYNPGYHSDIQAFGGDPTMNLV